MTPFTYESQQVRFFKDEDGGFEVIVKDVCEILDLGSPHKVVERLDDDEKGRKVIPTPGGPQEMITVNEPGLYTLIIRSNKPEAKKFKRWITHEVLPSIRKNGHYILAGEESDPAELILKRHPGVKINQRIRLLEMAYRMNDMSERCLVRPDEVVRATELYEGFCNWLQDSRDSLLVPSQKKFGGMLGKYFKKDKRGGIYSYFGIGLKVENMECVT